MIASAPTVTVEFNYDGNWVQIEKDGEIRDGRVEVAVGASA